MNFKKNSNVLYLTRNGLLEPLGQSQVLAYLKPLSKEYQFHIVSFEKAGDLKNTAYLKEIQTICIEHNIKWTPLSYRKGPRVLGIILGFLELITIVRKICRKEYIKLLHARSYFPTFIALYINWRYRIPFIFDMRALWPEELVVAGRLKLGTLAYRIIKFLEQKGLQRSEAVVSLTEAAVVHLAGQHPNIPITEKTTVIPTCADLSRFLPNKEPQSDSDRVVISCIGTLLSGWFKMNILKEVVRYLLEHYPQIDIEILTRDTSTKIRELLDPKDQWSDRILIESVPFADMPIRLRQQQGSTFFFNADISKLGSSPTRMGELLGTGIPVLANDGVGDVGRIIRQYQVGVLVEGEAPLAIHRACDAYLQLLEQPNIALRCRKVAEDLFSLEAGVEKYLGIYQKALG